MLKQLMLSTLFIVVNIMLLSCKSYTSRQNLECSLEDWMEVGEVTVQKNVHKPGFIAYESGMLIDADGSPRAYHPDDIGLDALIHAGGENGEKEGIVYMDGKPVIQGNNDPAPGYYVSQTSLEDQAKNITDPDRYVNAEVIPYVVLPAWISEKAGIRLGDIALVVNKKNNWYAYAIYADNGPPGIIGEGSMALAEMLEINNNPRYGGVGEGVLYFIFPGSGNQGPLSKAQIERRGKKEVEKFGGVQKLISCMNK